MQKMKLDKNKQYPEVKPSKKSLRTVREISTSVSPSGEGAGERSKPLTSFHIFLFCIGRAENLLKIHEAAHGKKCKPLKEYSDLHRAALLLAISALDAFIRTHVISEVRNILADTKRPLHESLLSRIKKYINHDALIDAARRSDLIDRVERVLQNDFEKQSFQGTKNITEGLQILGHNDIFQEIAVKAKMNEDTLKKELDEYTERRHVVAHRGDYDLNQKPPRENVITKKYANDCIRLVVTIAKTIDVIGKQR